jgi:hypothetical protein
MNMVQEELNEVCTNICEKVRREPLLSLCGRVVGII